MEASYRILVGDDLLSNSDRIEILIGTLQWRHVGCTCAPLGWRVSIAECCDCGQDGGSIKCLVVHDEACSVATIETEIAVSER